MKTASAALPKTLDAAGDRAPRMLRHDAEAMNLPIEVARRGTYPGSHAGWGRGLSAGMRTQACTVEPVARSVLSTGRDTAFAA